MERKKNKKNIGIATFSLVDGNLIPLHNLTRIIHTLSNQVYLITGNAGVNVVQGVHYSHITIVNHNPGTGNFERLYNYIKTQILIAYHIILLSKNVDIWIFPIGGEALLLGIIVSKILKIPVIMSLTASIESMMEHDKHLFNSIIKLFIKINYFLASKIILYSPSLISEWNLESYRHKILIAYEHFLDFKTFTVTCSYFNRPPIIGYIGRLSKEKGIENFIQALPPILFNQQDLRVFIGGDGPLKKSIEATIQYYDLNDKVNVSGWIPHDTLPIYLNHLRLLILPSYTEGLPNIMLEAMACGTPVLVTPVGAISDVIIEGETGFIMDNNSSECIMKGVERVLRSPNLNEIAENGRQHVLNNYSFEKTMENWHHVFEILNDCVY